MRSFAASNVYLVVQGDPGGRSVRSIFLVESRPVVRAGFRSLLAGSPFEIAGEASTIIEALASTAKPDIVVTELVLGRTHAAELVEALREHFRKANVCIFSNVDDAATVHAAISAGASFYLAKDASPDELMLALRSVAGGDSYVQLRLSAALAATGEDGVRSGLSVREVEVLRLLAFGHTSAEIGAVLSMSVRTVESHRSSIVRKLETHSRADLVRAALAAGLLDGYAPS